MKHETVNRAVRRPASPLQRPGRGLEHHATNARHLVTDQPETDPARTRSAAIDRLPISDDGCATFNVKEVATLLGVGRDAVYAAANRNEIPGTIRLGGRLLFARAKVLTWLGAPISPESDPDANARTGATLHEPTRVIG